jgi:hypothetical protein
LTILLLTIVGFYLENSPELTSSVPLVLSTSTGLISPQFHIFFKDNYTTTMCLRTKNLPSSCPVLETSLAKFVDDDFPFYLFIDPIWFTDQSSTHKDNNSLNETYNLPFQREPLLVPHHFLLRGSPPLVLHQHQVRGRWILCPLFHHLIVSPLLCHFHQFLLILVMIPPFLAGIHLIDVLLAFAVM